MKILNNPKIYVYPDKELLVTNLIKTTHLAFGAHPDDIEFFGYSAIKECQDSDSNFFTAVVLTSGSSSSLSPSSTMTKEELIKARIEENTNAAILGKYNLLLMLEYESDELTSSKSKVIKEIQEIINIANPKYIYTHNPFDNHKTHLKVYNLVIDSILKLDNNPKEFEIYGCEIWGSLDWLPSKYKKVLNCDCPDDSDYQLLNVFTSQIKDNKNYANAIIGRRLSNATFMESHQVDDLSKITFSLPLNPIIEKKVTKSEYVKEILKQFTLEKNQKGDRK